MKNIDYEVMYKKIFKILGDLTPLKADCGLLCERACCKGDLDTGMTLFPHEKTNLSVTKTADGRNLAVCDGNCDRNNRPLACRIFPFFPTISDNGKIFVELDYRAEMLCPLVNHCEEVAFNKRFFRALKRVGKLLAKNEECREFLYKTTEEIDLYYHLRHGE